MKLFAPINSEDMRVLSLPDDAFAESQEMLRAALAGHRNSTLQPQPFFDPVRWIRKNIRLPREASEMSGSLRLSSYQREMAILLTDDTVNELTILKGARIGWSLFISAMVAYFLAYLGKHVVIVQPTDDDAQQYFKEVIEPLFKNVKALRKLVRKPGKGEQQDTWNLIILKNGASLRMLGAASDDSFRRYGMDKGFGDEVSAKGWAPKKGSQGEKADLFKQRGGASSTSTMALGSTPLGKEDCRTYARFLLSDQRMPRIICPHCEHEQDYKWGEKDSAGGFKFTRDPITGYVDECWYQCESCGDDPALKITEKYKDFIDETVKWVPTSFSKSPGHVGLYIPQWLSFAGKAKWKMIAQDFISAQGNPERMKQWINNAQGWVWDDFTTSSMDASSTIEWARPYPAEVPDDVVVLTAGADTQTNKEGTRDNQIASRELQVVGWTKNGQFRIIGHWVVEGEPGDAGADKRMTALLDREFTKRDGTKMRIMAAAIDLGGHFSDATRAYTASFKKLRNIWAIKGRSNTKGSRGGTVWPRKYSKNEKSGAKFYSIDSHLARDAIFRLMQMKGSSAPALPISLLAERADFIEKLMCEERKKIGGGWYWQPKKGGRAEEEWMCLGYAYAALKGLQANYLEFRDLNLAAKRAGVVEYYDEETGEIDPPYSGEDMSAHSKKTRELTAPSNKAATERKAIVLKVPEQKANEDNSQPENVTDPVQPSASFRRKRRSGGLIV